MNLINFNMKKKKEVDSIFECQKEGRCAYYPHFSHSLLTVYAHSRSEEKKESENK